MRVAHEKAIAHGGATNICIFFGLEGLKDPWPYRLIHLQVACSFPARRLTRDCNYKHIITQNYIMRVTSSSRVADIWVCRTLTKRIATDPPQISDVQWPGMPFTRVTFIHTSSHHLSHCNTMSLQRTDRSGSYIFFY